MQDPLRETECHLATYLHKGVREDENKTDSKARAHQREPQAEILRPSDGFSDVAREKNTEDQEYQQEQETAGRRGRAAK